MSRIVYKIRQRKYAEAVFPIKVRPQDDELLSSWLIRVALAHRTMPTTFTNLYLPETRNKLWASDLDRQADRPLLESLSRKSALSVEELHGMTLRSYESVLFERLYAKSGGTPFVLPLQMRGRYPKSRGLRFCPYCLREDKQAYFRKKWRLSFSTVCLTHECFLLDECGCCGAPVSVYKGCRQGRASRCSRCGYDLRRCNSFKRLPGGGEGMEVLRWLYEIVDSGYVMLGGVPVYAHLYFAVLHQLVKLMLSKRYGVVLREAIQPGNQGIVIVSKRFQPVETLGIEKQEVLLQKGVWLLEKWPDRFVRLCRIHNLLSSALLRDMKQAPFWYRRVIIEALYRPGGRMNEGK